MVVEKEEMRWWRGKVVEVLGMETDLWRGEKEGEERQVAMDIAAMGGGGDELCQSFAVFPLGFVCWRVVVCE